MIWTSLFLLFSVISTTLCANSSLANRIENSEIEIEMLKKNIESQEEAREAFERDIRKLMKSTKESSFKGGDSLQKFQQATEKRIEKLAQDLKELKNHLNTFSKNQQEYQTRIDEKIAFQASSLEGLEKALRALTLALKNDSHDQKEQIYTVQSGDSLEKIAKKKNISVHALKEANNLQSHIIRKGQELKLPLHTSQ